LPKVEDTLSSVHGLKCFAKIDGKSGFFKRRNEGLSMHNASALGTLAELHNGVFCLRDARLNPGTLDLIPPKSTSIYHFPSISVRFSEFFHQQVF
jgi:hypothetical protein